MNLPAFSLKKPVTIIVIMVIFITIGIISLVKLPLEMFPDTSYPGLMVYVPYPSSSPEEVERTITRPLEDILSTINNLKNLNSTSSSSTSRIHMEFETGTNMDVASMEIRDKVDQIRSNLPDDIEKISIRRWSTSDFPVISFSISLPGGHENLYYLSENKIQPELERIEGVANVEIRGIRNKQLIITLKPELFNSSSLNILDLIDTIRNNNINISAGYVEESVDPKSRGKRYLVRVPGELKYVEEINKLPLNRQGLKIKDVATVTYDYPERDHFHRLNGHDSLSFRIYRASNANVVDVCRRVTATIKKMQGEVPELKKMEYLSYRDQSEDIVNSLRDLSFAGLIGGLLAILILLLFLRKLRSTIIIAVAIPMAVVFTFSFMYIYRALFDASITINIISLSGMMIAIGMLVDNSVVVLENIFRLKEEKGYPALKAAVEGSSEVAMAVTASTLTTLVVFISVSFVSASGFGRWMGAFALTISLALIASLLVSLTFIPLAGSKLLTGKVKPKARWLVKTTSLYERIIQWTIDSWKTKLVTVMAALLVLAGGLFMILNIERELMPSSEERELSMTVFMPRSFTLKEMQDLFGHFEKIFQENKQQLAIRYITTNYDTENLRQGRFRGSVDLYLTEEGPSIAEIKKKMQELAPPRAGITYEFGERRHRGGHSSGIRVELVGMDFTKLTELAPIVAEKLRTVEDVEDVTSDLEGGDTQLMVKVDRKRAESSGVDSGRVARTIMSSISDRPIGKFKTENKEIDIILKIHKERGFSQEDLKNLSLKSGEKQIPLSAISSFSYRMGSTSIRKENKKSKLRLSVNSSAKGMTKITTNIKAALDTIPFPEGYTWSFGSNWRRFQESEQGSKMAIILALIFIYIIMASLFESFVHPFTILLTVPLAVFGVGFFYTISGITLNTASYLGLLTLFGIVVNNGIILIDHIRTLRGKGLPKDRAIVQAGKDRLRPIVMTAITTIFGVLPMALPVLLPQFFPAAQGRAQMWAPISVAILGGLSTSTFFTLIILPTFYSIADSATTRVKKFFKFESHNPSF